MITEVLRVSYAAVPSR